MNAPFVQLATRVPEHLRRALKVRCVESEVSVEDFVAQAVTQRLERLARTDAHRAHARAARR